MQLLYWKSRRGNFGDDLNEWIWDFLLPGWNTVCQDVHLLGVGTILNSRIVPAQGKILVLGSGVGYGEIPQVRGNDRWDVRCVRGPLSAKALDLDEKLGLIDPAVMVADLPKFQNIKKTNRTAFVPHWESAVYGMWEQVCRQAGMDYIDPLKDPDLVIRQIASSKLIVTEAMHGAIIADAFRVPWIPVGSSENVNSFKWNDWTSTLNLKYQPIPVRMTSPVERSIKSALRRIDKSPKGNPTEQPCQSPPKSPSQSSPLRRRIRRVVMESALAAARVPPLRQAFTSRATGDLGRAAMADPFLSEDDVLNEKKERYREVLNRVSYDYGIDCSGRIP